jgi:ribosomal protein S12 methylthiotransferase accessory factor
VSVPGSSLRVRPVAETLAIARRLAPEVGITRVTDTTYLDRIGIPVFASIRPDAAPGSLCVSAGKGLTRTDAQVGAYMEAIELAWVDPARSRPELHRVPGRAILGGALADFGPRLGRPVDLDGPIDAVEAQDVITGEVLLVPAELAVYPMRLDWGGRLYFGSDGNGVCSGNTLDEATLHGLCEVIERDICSFHNSAEDGSAHVPCATLPPHLAALAARLQGLGFALHVRHLPSTIDLPCFGVFLEEPGARNAVHAGFGCHPSATIAVTRAICEAIQARLTVIHGGRDDLPGHVERLAAMPAGERDAVFARAARLWGDPSTTHRFDEIHDRAAEAADVPAALALVTDTLQRNGFRRILRRRFTPDDYPVVVLRILVPGLECHTAGVQRIGRRLAEFLRTRKKGPS